MIASKPRFETETPERFYREGAATSSASTEPNVGPAKVAPGSQVHTGMHPCPGHMRPRSHLVMLVDPGIPASWVLGIVEDRGDARGVSAARPLTLESDGETRRRRRGGDETRRKHEGYDDNTTIWPHANTHTHTSTHVSISVTLDRFTIVF